MLLEQLSIKQQIAKLQEVKNFCILCKQLNKDNPELQATYAYLLEYLEVANSKLNSGYNKRVHTNIEQTAIKLAEYYINTPGATIKSTAEHFDRCESTAYEYFKRVKFLDPILYNKLQDKIAINRNRVKYNFSK